MQNCILITGGAGFIGCAISHGLTQMGLPVVAVDKLSAQVHSKHERPSALDPAADLIVADICERAVWDRILSSYRPVTIIHLCAETGTAQSLTSSTLHASTNVVGTSEMLDALVRHDAIPSLFVLSSSRAVYGEGQWGAADGSLFYPFRRSHEQLSRGQWDPVGPDGKAGHPLPHSAATTMPLPTSIYGATKLAQEHMIAAWCSAFGTDLTAFRIQNAYGVGQSPINSYTGIINIFHKIAASKQPIDVYEDGNIGRDFIYISDVAEAIVAAAKVHLRGIEIIDLGTGRLTSIHEAAKIIARLHGAPEPKISGKFRDGDIRSGCAGPTALKKRLGLTPSITPEVGFQAVGEWLAAVGYS